tara:strand:+ start:509 stop:700 length:192 start_codon:yes stop_codon:yes gene_type:complete
MTKPKHTVVTIKVEFAGEYPYEIEEEDIDLHEIIRNPDLMKILKVSVKNKTLKLNKENKLGVA